MFKKMFKKRVLFVGIPDMAYVCLDGLKMSGVNIVGVIGPKKDHGTYFTFRKFVKSRGLEFIEYETLDDPFFIEKIRNLKADIAVVCSFNYKVPRVLLNSVKDGFINVHPSLLPKYRGPNPYSAVIINDESETGVTLHFMDETFDTGDIIVQKKIPVSKVETMGTLFNRTNIFAFDMLLDTLKKYERGEISSYKQAQGDYVRGKILLDDELFIDYNQPALKIESFIRALNPFLFAKTTFRGTMIKVLSAEVFEGGGNDSAGKIVKVEGDKFLIATGNGLLAMTSMQFGSFFAGTSKEFIEILNPRVGETFE